MSINWVYLAQQLLLLILSGILATGLAAVGRALLRPRRASLSIWLEIPLITAALLIVGIYCRELGYGHLLPNLEFPWTVGVGMAFYWLAVWWPLRVFRARRELRHDLAGRLARVGAAVCVLGAIYATMIETQLLELEPLELVFDEIEDEGTAIRLAHVSDTQLIALGPRENALVRAVNAFEPHLIVFSGDYIAGIAGEDVAIAAMRSILSRLRASHGIYATTSDSDDDRQRQLIFDGLPVNYLVNDSATVEVAGVRVRIGGLDHIEPDIDRMARHATDAELFVVACHNPDLALEVSQRVPAADLYLCGHTHGGQLNVPGFGPLLTFCESPREIAAGGIFATARGMPFLVTRGIGTEGDYAPRFRFNCRPHMFLVTLRGRSGDGSAGGGTPTR